MTITYKTLDNREYLMSYQNLKEEYHRFCEMTDIQFMMEIPAALHLACVICFLKEIPTDACLCDDGIIHELIHLNHIPNQNTTSLEDIRELFKKVLILV